jgi:hypothetical protein
LDLNLTEIISTIQEQKKKLLEALFALQTEIDNWKSLATKLEASQLSNPVVLDVGGTKFSCSPEKLLQVSDSYFSALLSGRWELKTQKDGSLFIDRDPTVFPLIMTYTRNRRVGFNVEEWILTLSEREKALLRKEAKFYCLEELLVPEDGNILEKDWWVHVH